ncbi:MAG: hypothetical protein BWY78_00068 [Alphaproteobacteria bacterium ADurb.Bin438]|nr:MAG: hypothetical protein BWY78_00068 [Alphaproteobacteria bacterium ADurb.Bin438]
MQKAINKLWAIDDTKQHIGCKKVTFNQAKQLNEQNFGIFFTPNDFDGARKTENLSKINYWYADIDEDTKENQFNLISKLVLYPSCIVETKKGFHLYWKALNPTIDNFEKIEKGIIKKTKSDRACKDVTRLLRCPNFYHCKDPVNKFLIKVIHNSDKAYTEEQMLFHFRLPPEKKLVYSNCNKDLDFYKNPDNWEKVYKLNKISKGGRNNMLKDQVYKSYMQGFRGDDLITHALNLNSKLSEPLPRWEVINMTRGLK